MNYYTGDLHFGHANVLKFDHRPFQSVEEMDRVLMEQWNAVVKPEDDVYILGDFCYRSQKDPLWYLERLKGKKHLIRGNHDGYVDKREDIRKHFVSIDDLLHLWDGSREVILCHYPLAEWPRFHRGAYHIYGHIHSKKSGCYSYMEEQEKALNAGCMVNHYTPVTLRQMIKNNREFQENKDYLWEKYGDHTGPLQMEEGYWIMPSVIPGKNRRFMDTGDSHYIFGEYCGSGLIYHYHINGERDHEHTFGEVLDTAYYFWDTFEIIGEDRKEYSSQELEFLDRLLQKCRTDRRKGGELR